MQADLVNMACSINPKTSEDFITRRWLLKMSNIIKRMYKNYLCFGNDYLTFSPLLMRSDGYAIVGNVGSPGVVDSYYVSNTHGVRPVVSFISGTLVTTDGDGTSTHPYVVK